MKRPLVVKFGTSLIAGKRGQIRRQVLRERAREISELVNAGTPVCVVSSGAIALGLTRLGIERRPRSMPKLQAASALGQGRLQAAWEEALGAEGIPAAQILLTAVDVSDRSSYVNARNALNALFAMGAVPVVNENDATATDEISLGDNDALAAQVAVLAKARLLVLLTEVEGVLSRAPGTPGAQLIADGSATRTAVLGGASSLGKGGMRSKVVAAEVAAAAGIPTVIAAGTGTAVLKPILDGEPRGTRFTPGERTTSAFKLWLRFGKPTAGILRVDDGARDALTNDGASLLAVGIARCEGRFAAGDGVEIVGSDGPPFAKGIASASSDELRKKPRGLEAVHRDRLVLY
jgi:glutamate 5-kinase